MFAPPRFVVVDDKSKHLAAILSVFQELGAPCQGVLYDPERELDSRHFRNVRVLFVDLHLTDLAETTDEKRHFAIIADILQENISRTGGPFILVVWTEHEESVDGLRSYLDDSIAPESGHARPLAVVGLPKGPFIDVDTGEFVARGAEALRVAVEKAVSEQPQLAALVAWETDVQMATGATLSALLDLVPDETRKSTTVADALDEILSRLGVEAVGQEHVAADPRAAINSALAPILSDRIVNQDVPDGTAEAWRQAVTGRGGRRLDASRAGTVNRMLHVAVPSSETIRSTDWGAVVELPAAWANGEEFQRRFEVPYRQLLGGEYKIERDDRDACRPRLVRVGAACDHVQNRSGPLLYLFGLEIPDNVSPRKDDDGKPIRLPAAVWSSPALLLGNHGPFKLAVHTRYWVSVVPADAASWNPLYRLRERLLMHLISHASGHMARPGIVHL